MGRSWVTWQLSWQLSRLVTQLVAACKQTHREHSQHHEKGGDDREAHERIDIRLAEKTVAKAVDHVEERIEPRHLAPAGRQRMRRIEHTRQERERHDDEVLERGELVELLGPDAGHHAEGTENRGPEH